MEIMKLKKIGIKKSGYYYTGEITNKLKELSGLYGEFTICHNRSENVLRIEYDNISILDYMCNIEIDGIYSMITLNKLTMYINNLDFVGTINNNVINKMYSYLKGLEKNVILEKISY